MSTQAKLKKLIAKPKRARSSISLEEKLKIIRMHDDGQGQSITSIARELKRPHATVHTILQDKDRIEGSVHGPTSLCSMVTCRKRKDHVVEMERLLAHWIEDRTLKRIPTGMKDVQQKAMSLYIDLIDLEGGPATPESAFKASNGWYQCFKMRISRSHIKVLQQAHSKGNITLPPRLEEIIATEGYLPQQIFNIGETPLFWKRSPTPETYGPSSDSSSSGFNMAKDRITVMLGSNASGDFKLIPHTVYHTHMPRAFKDVHLDSLPVVWQCHYMENWIEEHFIPQVEKYFRRKRIPFKILLLLDDTMRMPTVNTEDLTSTCPYLKIVYFPPHTRSQPLDQGIFDTFQAYYFRHILLKAKETIDSTNTTFKKFWTQYHVLDAVKNIAAAWADITEASLSSVWKELLKTSHLLKIDEKRTNPVATAEFNGVLKECVELARYLGLEVDADCIRARIMSQDEGLTNDDLVQLELFINSDENTEYRMQTEHEEKMETEVDSDESLYVEVVPDIPTPTPQRFTKKSLSDALELIDMGLSQIGAMDSNNQRFESIRKNIKKSLATYMKLLDDT